MELKDSKGKVVAKVTAADPNIAGCDEGIWLEVQADDKTKPTLCLVKDKPDGPHKGNWYLGVYRDANQANAGCDLAVTFDKEKGPVLQIVKPGHPPKIVSLYDLV